MQVLQIKKPQMIFFKKIENWLRTGLLRALRNMLKTMKYFDYIEFYRIWANLLTMQDEKILALKVTF